ncbi:MAG: FkbM family methyltransferase [Thiogranum sp.]|nr:FkbM family methyltransferase [Thiogranum sp.]
MTGLKKLIHKIAREAGFDIIRYKPRTHPLARRKKILDTYNIDLLLDVGANIGQYGEEMREIGYAGRLISFEPMSKAFGILKEKAQYDNLWEVHNFGLGDREETASINISGNSFSSSMLNMLPSHLKSAPASEYVDQETIQVKVLDGILPGLVTDAKHIYLKIDTQGFEENVLKGAENSLASIDTLQVEMSLVPLYENGLLFDQLYKLLYDRGYRLMALEPGFTDPDTGQLLQADGIFHRI